MLPGFGAALAHAYNLSGQIADWSQRREDEAALTELIYAGVTDVPPLVTLNMEPSAEVLQSCNYALECNSPVDTWDHS